MVDPATITAAATQLTTEQISGMIQSRMWGLIISGILSTIGFTLGAKTKQEVAKIIFMIVGVLGAVGTIVFLLKVLELTKLF